MSDEYVRKDLYDEGIKRIEAMMATSEANNRASEARHREYTNRVVADFNRIADRMADAINSIRDKQDEYDRKHDRFINYMSIVATVCGVIVAVAQLYMVFKG